MADLKKLLIDIASSIVEKPEEVVVDERADGDNIVFTLHVAESDMGKVIGRHGKNARCIRAIMKAGANSVGKKVTVDIE